jgi:hypothetical protein
MDSIVARTNDGFDKDGVFHNGQTQLLPWPEFTVNGSYFDIFCADTRFTDTAAVYGDINILPCPYDAGFYYALVNNSGQQYINKYDSTGAIIWTYPCSSIWSRYERARIFHFYDDGINRWLLGSIQDESTGYKPFKLNVNGTESGTSAAVLTNARSITGFGTLEDDTLYCITYRTSSGNGYYSSYFIDIETLSEGASAGGLGIQAGFKINQTATSAVGAPIFNGSVLLLESIFPVSGGNWLCTHFALNSTLQFDSHISSKAVIKSTHTLSQKSFFGQIKQLSKDAYYSPNKPSDGSVYSPNSSYHAKFYTRAELEKWVSNSVFAVTGFRIPLSNQGA